jgi:hypothetical protein
MKYCFFTFFFIPYLGIAQENKLNKVISHFLTKEWSIVKSVNIKDSNDILYDHKGNIKKWNLDSAKVYSLGKNQVGLIDGDGDIEWGEIDSVSANRFLVNVSYAGGIKCVNEYSDIRFSDKKLSYVFRVWYKSIYTNTRHLHHGYSANCVMSNKKLQKPNLAQVQKLKKGNKIKFEFTYEDGKPISNKEIKISIHLENSWVLTTVNTDILGKVTSYFPDSYFATNEHITMLMQYGNIKSSAVLELKYCPTTLKRILTDKEDDTDKIGVMRSD